MRFHYSDGWSVTLEGEDGLENQSLFIAEGMCEGRIGGRMRGANHPRRRVDRTFVTDFHGVIETDDGATVLFEAVGYGRAYPVGRRQIVSSLMHVSDHADYRWLNDVVCVGTGEVRTLPGNDVELVLDVAQLVFDSMED